MEETAVQRRMNGFGGDRHGGTLMTFALTAFLVLAAVGGAIDFSMFTVERNKVQDALDQAALTAAISSSTDQATLQKLANKTFNANFNTTTINASIQDFKFDTTGRTFQLTATGTYTPYLLHLVGINSLPYTVTSKTVRAADGTLEVALVLDNTWSMSVPLDGSQTKIQVLKTAAQSLITSVMTSANKNYVKVAVVPYADYVNVGTANRNQPWLSVPADSTTTTTTPGTCKTISTKTTCTGGTAGTCTGTQDGVSYNYSCWIVPQTCTTVNITPYQSCTATTTSTTTKKWFGCVRNQMKSNALVLPDPATPYVGISETSQHCLSPIVPLTNDSSAISAALNGLVVNIGGYKPETYIPAGLVWGVDVLSPPAPFQEGAAYDANNKQPRKTIVLMTDGANTLYSNSSGNIAVANATQLAATYSDQAKVCAYAKSKNIEIYTIGFGVTDATALAALKSCATDASHYFDAKSSADLIAAFQTIGGKLTQVRITQ